MKKAIGFVVMNDTDKITASPEVYPNKTAANKFIKEFRKRFESQGYYSSPYAGQIDPEDIALRVAPYTGGFVLYKKP